MPLFNLMILANSEKDHKSSDDLLGSTEAIEMAEKMGTTAGTTTVQHGYNTKRVI